MHVRTEPAATLPGNPRRVLLLTTSHLGSNIFCTPAIRLLKRRLPQVRFDVVASSTRGVSAFESNPDVDAVYCRRTARGVRRLAARYDLVLGLHHDQAARFLAGTRVPHLTIGPGAETHGHRAEEILDFVRGLLACTVTERDRHYVVCPQARHRARVDRLLDGSSADDVLVGFHLGTGRTAVHGWKFWFPRRDSDLRLWPSSAFIEVARRLRAASPRIRPVVIGVRNERFLARRFDRAVPGSIDLTGRTSLLEVAALMPRLDVLLCADSGVLHVACTTPVPIVALFGPTSPARSGPYPARARCIVLRDEPIAAIRAGDVAAAIMRLLAPRVAVSARERESVCS